MMDLDVVCAGPDCISFSSEGSRKGLSDTNTKKQLSDFIDIIAEKMPKCTVMENVVGFPLAWFQSRLRARMGETYKLWWRILDARFFGLPQRRKRLFIVILRTDALKAEVRQDMTFKWPRAVLQSMTVTSFCKKLRSRRLFRRQGAISSLAEISLSERKQVKRVIKHVTKQNKAVDPSRLIIDMQTRRGCNYGIDVLPTITASKAASLSFYHDGWRRRFSLMELAMLQGFSVSDCSGFASNALNQQAVGRLIGNAIAAPVLMKVLKAALNCIRF